MLEKIMNLHLLLYAMIVLGGLGALGIWPHILLTED